MFFEGEYASDLAVPLFTSTAFPFGLVSIRLRRLVFSIVFGTVIFF